MMAVVFLTVAFIIPGAWGEGASWDCPECGRTGNTGLFCGNCGHSAPRGETKTQISVGAMVTFGTYEQDNNVVNGPEAIEWIVLDYDEKEHKALLLSKYGLDVMPYNQTKKEMTWEACTLRQWLNGEFLQYAFSTREQNAIQMTATDNSASQKYSEWKTNGGNQTQDQIFLLSYAEANRFLGVEYSKKNIKACVTPTAYAISRGAMTTDSNDTSDGESAAVWWWLRSPGSNQRSAATVNISGSLRSFTVNNNTAVVRPALWVNTDSGIF